MSEIDQILDMASTPEGRRRAIEEIHRRGGSVYGSDSGDPEIIIQHMPDGTTRRGRFVDRKFVELAD